MAERWHGTLNGYTNQRCRCEKCRAANAAYYREYKRRAGTGPVETWHGTAGGYTNHGCRCEHCRRAWREYYRRYRKTRRALKLGHPTE